MPSSCGLESRPDVCRRYARVTKYSSIAFRTSRNSSDALTWAGTFHGIGARLLREYSDRIGLDPAFTIHDREDSADLMNLVRHEKGFSKTKSRFPTKGTCLSIYSRCVMFEKTAIAAARLASQGPRIDVGARMRGMWR